MRNIFLIGFMGAGKSTVARELSRQCSLSVIEMDQRIVEKEGRTIAEIFRDAGEAYFRGLETDLLKSLTGAADVVVSCGGGAAMREENVRLMRESGTVVYLTATPQTIFDRVRGHHDRPLLEGNMNVAYIASLMEKRNPHYLAAADICIATDGKSAGEICEEIIRACAQKEMEAV